MQLLLLVVALVFASVQADVEDPDVVVLTADNFDEFIKNDFVLVEFYAPWCGHCKKLAPEYAKAATELKNSGSPVKLGKVDATVEGPLAEKFAVRGYPTLKFFRSGSPIEYDGGRTTKDIINWVSKKSGPASKTLAAQSDLDTVVAGSGTRVVAFIPADQEATWLDVAKNEKVQAFLFSHATDASAFNKKEGTVELHKDGEETKTYSGDFNSEDLLTWILSEGYPLVDELAQESWTRALSAGSDLLAVFLKKGDEATNVALEVAKAYKGKLVVTSSEQLAIAQRWGASGNLSPTAIYVVNTNGQPSFVIWNEDSAAEFNVENLKAFVEGAKDGSYDSYIKSEAVPEPNDEPVTVLVGKNFNDIVNQKKDVLVEFYAPWCGHCQKLAPIYDELGAAYKNDDNVVIAKIDATANGLPKGINVQGFPTLIFFDANGDKHTYDGERELPAFKSWIESKRVTKAATGEEKEDL